jgi:hypothetical protein
LSRRFLAISGRIPVIPRRNTVSPRTILCCAKPDGDLDQPVIEESDARFDPVRHAAAILPVQQPAGGHRVTRYTVVESGLQPTYFLTAGVTRLDRRDHISPTMHPHRIRRRGLNLARITDRLHGNLA